MAEVSKPVTISIFHYLYTRPNYKRNFARDAITNKIKFIQHVSKENMVVDHHLLDRSQENCSGVRLGF